MSQSCAAQDLAFSFVVTSYNLALNTCSEAVNHPLLASAGLARSEICAWTIGTVIYTTSQERVRLSNPAP